MAKIFGYVFLIWSVVTIVSCFKRNEFPLDYSIPAALLEEPSQSKIEEAPFAVSYGGVGYRVEPKFDYILTGLVVSFRHHDGDSMLHKLWNDHFNVSDVCVVWGGNTQPNLLRDLDFWNGQFTCNVKTDDAKVWSRFRTDQLSNNHLVSADDYLRKKIATVKVGDQIRIRGKLSAYSAENGGTRGTSTTRTDTGNGACETIYIEDFQVMQSMDSLWRTLLFLSWIILPLSLIGYLWLPNTR